MNAGARPVTPCVTAVIYIIIPTMMANVMFPSDGDHRYEVAGRYQGNF